MTSMKSSPVELIVTFAFIPLKLPHCTLQDFSSSRRYSRCLANIQNHHLRNNRGQLGLLRNEDKYRPFFLVHALAFLS